MGERRAKGKELVKLKRRKLSNGDVSLYLEYYKGVDPETKKPIREKKSLGIQLRTKDDRNTKNELERVAEATRAKEDDRLRRLKAVSKGIILPPGKTDVFALMDDYVNRELSSRSESYQEGATHAFNWFKAFLANRYGGVLSSLSVESLEPSLMSAFADYAINRGSGDTGRVVFGRFRVFIRWMAGTGQLGSDPTAGIRLKTNKRKQKPKKETLDPDELARLWDVKLPPKINPEVLRAFKLSVLTGMRISDVRALTGRNVDLKKHVLKWRQRKTGDEVVQPLTPMVMEVLGDIPQNDAPIIRVPTKAIFNRHLTVIMKAAGIEKHITSHCARHTFGTLMIESGAAPTVAQAGLGHSSLQHTRRYIRTKEKSVANAIGNYNELITKAIEDEVE